MIKRSPTSSGMDFLNHMDSIISSSPSSNSLSGSGVSYFVFKKAGVQERLPPGHIDKYENMLVI